MSPARGEIRYGAPPVARFIPAKAVGSFVPTLTRKAFEKFGFSTATLITDWAAIAGAEIAGYTMPERLKWPRGAGSGKDDDIEGDRRGATLVLRVDPARALDVEYRARQIVERINAYFGYRAVEALRIVQAPLPGIMDRTALPPAPCGERPEVAGGTASVDPLAAALARLEQGVRRDHAIRRA